MNYDAIKRTAVCWIEDGDYVVGSPLYPIAIGAGDTEAEAWKIFYEMIDDSLYEAKNGRYSIYDQPGRPKKFKKALNIEVMPDTRQQIKELAEEIGISQGDAVDYIMAYYRAYALQAPASRKRKKSA